MQNKDYFKPKKGARYYPANNGIKVVRGDITRIVVDAHAAHTIFSIWRRII